HDQDPAPGHLDEEEGVGGEEAGRVEDVGVGLGGGVEEPREVTAPRAHPAVRPRARARAASPSGRARTPRPPPRTSTSRDATTPATAPPPSSGTSPSGATAAGRAPSASA